MVPDITEDQEADMEDINEFINLMIWPEEYIFRLFYV